MKNWREWLEHRPIRIEHYPDIDVDDDALEEDELQEVEQQYRDVLLEELPTAVALMDVEEDEELAAGGGWEPEVINILLSLGSAAGVYASLRVVADDVRSVITRLKASGPSGVSIDETAAWLLAWDYLVPPNSEVVVEVEHVGRTSTFSDDGYLAPRGWLVGLRLDGQPKIVIVSDDGSVVGVADGFDYPREMKRVT